MMVTWICILLAGRREKKNGSREGCRRRES
jgi:hypothetical protein